jgi:hypothetical protein
MSDIDNANMVVQLLHDCICNAIAAMMAALRHALVQHNIVINHGLILNVATSTKKYLHMQSFILTAI